MAVSDPIADMITRIRNAIMVRHKTVSMPSSKMKLEIAQILQEEGFIAEYEVRGEGTVESSVQIGLHYWGRNEPAITGVKRISKPGLRVYVGRDQIPHVLGGRGIAVMSTNQGIMSGSQARSKGIGGEVLFHVW